MPDSESPKYPRKILIDYIFEGGIKGRFFINDAMGFMGEEIEPPNPVFVYEVLGCDSPGPSIRVNVRRLNGPTTSRNLADLIFGVEVTPEEIRQFREAEAKAKASDLAAKVLG